VTIGEESGEGQAAAVVIVPDNQLSLAIGKKGQNARLAAKLPGMRIDIKSEAEVEAERASGEARATDRAALITLAPVSPELAEAPVVVGGVHLGHDDLALLAAGARDEDDPAAVADVRAGKAQAIGFLVGAVMKQTRGQANAAVVQAALKARLAIDAAGERD